ncbi:hypothetical protein GALMADRAFT_213945 [Galerina marginata CBS 339.88]|uniref:Uncharacterized protein n=1 Tax=Galerina marginata (strain CBS 339.88) TaxID=685588 RepID=A0A067SMG3_GALM3|nr:hypothetical protein GALMADRAFT_213945 [Galerina marginata CBS 339.88]
MQFTLFTTALVACMTVIVSASPIPVPAPNAVVAREPATFQGGVIRVHASEKTFRASPEPSTTREFANNLSIIRYMIIWRQRRRKSRRVRVQRTTGTSNKRIVTLA